MKYLIIFLLLISCNNKEYHIISYKSPYMIQGFNHVLLPKGLCYYGYGLELSFIDSCKFYYVGDTLERRRK